jgi:hypothetical protein
MRSGIFLTLVTTTLLLVSDARAQDMGIYTGRGIPDSFGGAPETKKSRLPRLLDFTKDEPEASKPKPFSKLFTPKMPFANRPLKFGSDPADSAEEPKPRRSFSDLFPKRDPDRPNLLEQMNAKSRNFMDRTTGWAQRQNQQMRERSFATWDAITRRSREDSGRLKRMKPAQPPIRTTDVLDKPGVRY